MKLPQLAQHSLIAGLLMLVGLPGHASAFVLPLLQRAECSAVEGWAPSADAVLSCAGDVRLAGGTWESESAIVVRADGLLTLSDLSIRAPSIDLQGGSVWIDGDVSLASLGGSIRLAISDASGGSVGSAGGTITVAGRDLSPLLESGVAGGTRVVGGFVGLSPVPEPETLALWLAGLALLGAHRRSTATQVSRSTVA